MAHRSHLQNIAVSALFVAGLVTSGCAAETEGEADGQSNNLTKTAEVGTTHGDMNGRSDGAYIVIKRKLDGAKVADVKALVESGESFWNELKKPRQLVIRDAISKEERVYRFDTSDALLKDAEVGAPTLFQGRTYRDLALTTDGAGKFIAGVDFTLNCHVEDEPDRFSIDCHGSDVDVRLNPMEVILPMDLSIEAVAEPDGVHLKTFARASLSGWQIPEWRSSVEPLVSIAPSMADLVQSKLGSPR